MKSIRLPLAFAASFLVFGSSYGGTLNQTFESGEDTSDWGVGSSWSNYTTDAGFLSAGLGGASAGLGSSANGQEASRVFKNNTVGIDVATEIYTVSMYVRLSGGELSPSSGKFSISDGDYGNDANAAKIFVEGSQGGQLTWQLNNNGGSIDTGVAFAFDTNYFLTFTVNPLDKTYTATISQVDGNGAVVGGATHTEEDIAFGSNVVGNGQNGKLLFHVEGSAGTTVFQVDNITITDAAAVPEPVTSALLAVSAVGAFTLIRRRSRLAA